MKFATYSLVVDQMPGFLVPFMRDELNAALAARGATEVAANADIEFHLRFEPVMLLAGNVPSGDKFEATIAPESATRFVAQATLSAVLSGKSTPIIVGKISRVHTVSAGTYMHPRAHPAIRHGFDQLLDGFMAPAER